MLISLILICSLARLASAADSNPIAAAPVMIKPDGCGTVYKCIAPEKCTDLAKATDDNVKWEDFVIKEITNEVSNNCPALIKFHAFHSYYVHVSIESYLSSASVTSIDFIQLNQQGSNEKSKFSCFINDDNMLAGTFEQGTKSQLKFTEAVPDKIKCTFPIKTMKKDTGNIFDADNEDTVQFKFKMNGKEEKTLVDMEHSALNIFKLRCDPDSFEKNDGEDSTKIYNAVTYLFEEGKLTCKNLKNYKIEYRRKPADAYKILDMEAFQCSKSKFNMKTVDDPAPARGAYPYLVDHGSNIDVRCVAEVKYLCNYNLKKKGDKTLPDYTPPNYPGEEATRLKCPDDKPHLIFGERDMPIFNATFECVNYGGTPLWTIGERTFPENGAEVYCTKELKCDIFFTIPESAVQDGVLSTHDNFPKCHDNTGVMWAGTDQVSGFRCNSDTGKYMYTTEGGKEQIIDSNTKFVCKYPPEKDEAEKQNIKNAQTLTVGISSSIGICTVLILAGIAACVWLSMHQAKKDKKKLVELNNAENLLWGTPSQKEAARKADKLNHRSSSQGSENAEDIVENKQRWNALITSLASAAKNATRTLGKERKTTSFCTLYAGKSVSKLHQIDECKVEAKENTDEVVYNGHKKIASAQAMKVSVGDGNNHRNNKMKINGQLQKAREAMVQK